MSTPKVWYVTGASQGLGLILVKKLLKKGHRVAATSRSIQTLTDAVAPAGSNKFLPLEVDLSKTENIDESVRQSITAFGQIDVLVNNAGYGMAGTIEETEGQEIRDIIDVNLVATINVTKSVLPIMRRQQTGYIINIGSVSSFSGAPGWSVYSATKAAVAAFSEVIALELKEFGIGVTVVEQSRLRTGFLTKNSTAYTGSKIDGCREIGNTKAHCLAADDKQPCDPEKAAGILIELAEQENKPTHLYLGKEAYNRAMGKLNDMLTELEEWKETTMSADFKD